jgi:ElaB/YqjD/DUF883 family membrane-anchored ribosome-binding protein
MSQSSTSGTSGERMFGVVEDAAHSVAGAAGKAGAVVREQAGATLQSAMDGAAEAGATVASAAKEQASELQKLIAEELRAHPVRSLAIAAGIGLFLGTRRW